MGRLREAALRTEPGGLPSLAPRLSPGEPQIGADEIADDRVYLLAGRMIAGRCAGGPPRCRTIEQSGIGGLALCRQLPEAALPTRIRGGGDCLRTGTCRARRHLKQRSRSSRSELPARPADMQEMFSAGNPGNSIYWREFAANSR